MGILSDSRQDLSFARRQAGFTLIAVLTLALGIGGTTAIFSIVQAVILRPLPVASPDRVALVFETSREGERQGLSLGRRSHGRPGRASRGSASASPAASQDQVVTGRRTTSW